jgi:hypothetical protein
MNLTHNIRTQFYFELEKKVISKEYMKWYITFTLLLLVKGATLHHVLCILFHVYFVSLVI